MKLFIEFIQQLPQNLVGLIIFLIFKCKGRYHNGRMNYDENNQQIEDDLLYIEGDIDYAISLGNFIVLYRGYTQNDKKHEFGHTKQSKLFGWLYFLIIGIPSAIWCLCFKWLWTKPGHSYYDFWVEAQANELGGIC